MENNTCRPLVRSFASKGSAVRLGSVTGWTFMDTSYGPVGGGTRMAVDRVARYRMGRMVFMMEVF